MNLSTSAANRIAELEEWCRCAYEALQLGVALMPPDQLRQWTGVRAAIEECLIETDEQGRVIWPAEGDGR